MSKRLFYVKRIDSKHGGDEVLIPEEHLQATLRQHKTWKVTGEYQKPALAQEKIIVEAPITKEPLKPECPLCGKLFKNDNGLRLHKKVHTK